MNETRSKIKKHVIIANNTLNKKNKKPNASYLFSVDDPRDLLSSLAPLAVDTVSTFPSRSNVVSMLSLDVSVGLSALGERLYGARQANKNKIR